MERIQIDTDMLICALEDHNFEVHHYLDDFSYEDITEKIYFMQKVEAGLKGVEEGRLIPLEEVKKRLAKWLK